MIVANLAGMPNMYPFTEERTIYSRKIAGETMAEHLLGSIVKHSPKGDVRFIVSEDALREDSGTLELIKRFCQGKEKIPKGAVVVNGNEYWLSSSQKITIRYPWQLLDVMKHVLGVQEANISPSAQIADNVHIEGNVYLGDNVRLSRGAIVLGDVYIGDDTFVGAYSLVRGPCNIEARCKIGYSVELKNAIIQEDTMVGPLCFIADSIVGSDCSFGALTRTSNFRLDRQPVKVKFDAEFVDSQLAKLGAFIGDDVQTGVSVVILPGRKVGNHVHIGPNIVVVRNLQSKKRYMLKQEVTCTELET